MSPSSFQIIYNGDYMKINNVKIFENLSDEEVFKVACKKNRVNINDVEEWHIAKKSVDARDKSNVHFSYSFDVLLKGENREPQKDLLLFARSSVIYCRSVLKKISICCLRKCLKKMCHTY